jgi:phenylalanyl-tRNA synthetase beta chain
LRISLNWLNEYLPIADLEPSAIAKALTDIGLEVEAIESIATIQGDVVVGKILKAEKHPDADSLKVCQVDVGRGEALEIVCGAPNAREGLVACVALIGSTLPGDFKIKKSKIRGVTSNGMMLAEDELGISKNHDTIIELPASTKLGSSVAELYKLNDTVLVLGITPNRADCLGYLGVARDLAAKLDIPLNEVDVSALMTDNQLSTAKQVKIEVESADDCPRFCAIALNGVSATKSPLWMEKRLTAAGMRPINMIVDVTNYVMLEFGQPIHAYDVRNLSGNTIKVRRAKAGEKLTTLDGNERKLSENDILITDSEKAVGLAGVMGGANTEVAGDTTAIIVEVASFDAAKVRSTSKRLGIHTEASHRFERGTDMTVLNLVVKRVAALLQQVAMEQGLPAPKVAADVVDLYPAPVALAKVALRISRAKRILGVSVLEQEKAIKILASLRFNFLDKTEDRLLFEIPAWRADVTREIDLVEELGRMIGFDQIPYATPMMDIAPLFENPLIEFLDEARVSMSERGFSETISLPFVSEQDLAKFQIPEGHPLRQNIVLTNPLAEETSLMQPTLAINLVKAVALNRRYGKKGCRLFECGRSYHANKIETSQWSYLTHLSRASTHLVEKAKSESRATEKNLIAAMMDQPFAPKNWQTAGANASFYHLKSVAISFLKSFGIDNPEFSAPPAGEIPFLHPGASALVSVGKTVIGYLGHLHPETCLAFDLDTDPSPLLLEFALDEVLTCKGKARSYAVNINRFPPVTRDLAFVVNRGLSYNQLRTIISKFPRKKYLKEFHLFDLYEGEHVASDKKSAAISLAFQSPDKTLQERDVEHEITGLINWLKESCDATLR